MAAEKAANKQAKPAKPYHHAGAQPVSAAESLMNSLVSQYQSAMNVVNPYISGQAGTNAVNTAVSGAAAAGGPTGPAPSTQAGGLAMIAGDAANYAKANQAGAQGIEKALTDTGQANAEYLGVSPYLGILNALTSEAQYKTETGAPPTQHHRLRHAQLARAGLPVDGGFRGRCRYLVGRGRLRCRLSRRPSSWPSRPPRPRRPPPSPRARPAEGTGRP